MSFFRVCKKSQCNAELTGVEACCLFANLKYGAITFLCLCIL